MTTDAELEELAREYHRGVRTPEGLLILSAVDRKWLENIAAARGPKKANQPTPVNTAYTVPRPADCVLGRPDAMRGGRYRLTAHGRDMREWSLSVTDAARISGWTVSQVVSLAVHGWIPAVPVPAAGLEIVWKFRRFEIEAVSWDGEGIPSMTRRSAGPRLMTRNGRTLQFPTAYR